MKADPMWSEAHSLPPISHKRYPCSLRLTRGFLLSSTYCDFVPIILPLRALSFPAKLVIYSLGFLMTPKRAQLINGLIRYSQCPIPEGSGASGSPWFLQWVAQSSLSLLFGRHTQVFGSQEIQTISEKWAIAL